MRFYSSLYNLQGTIHPDSRFLSCHSARSIKRWLCINSSAIYLVVCTNVSDNPPCPQVSIYRILGCLQLDSLKCDDVCTFRYWEIAKHSIQITDLEINIRVALVFHAFSSISSSLSDFFMTGVWIFLLTKPVRRCEAS